MYLIFDTETTGLPRNFDAPVTDLDNWPRLVQLAWQLHDARGALLHAGNHIVRPEGFTIPFNAEKIHGISTERALAEGKPLAEVLAEFAASLGEARAVIGHNISFDLNIVGAEYLRADLYDPLPERQPIDTKDEGTAYTQIPGGIGGKFKWPTLTELHEKLFGEGFADAHDAAYDVDATARCFFGLIREGVTAPIDGTPVADIAYEAPALEAANFVKAKPKRDAVDFEQAKHRKVERVIPFSHLRAHSHYSILQSTLSVKELVARAKADGMAAVALTDYGNMFGAFDAVAAGKKQNVKVILGCELYVARDRRKQQFTKNDPDRRFLQVLLAKHQRGYENLSRLCSLGYLEGYYAGYPRVDKEIIREYADGLIALTGGPSGEVPGLILNVGEHQAEAAFCWWLDLFGDDFYVELLNHGLEEEQRVNEVLLKFADKYHVKPVATNDTFYPDADGADTHDTLLCVKDGEQKSTPVGRGRGKRFAFPNHEYYFKSQREMNALFADLPEALETIQEIVDKTEPIEVERKVMMPNFELPEGFENQDDYLRHLSYEGARQRYGDDLSEEVRARLDLELGVVARMGFPGYFLIVQDFINAAKDLGVFVGPGRGSAAGSVVAYCTGITNVDPLAYDLLFERFLNPERVSMPDIDIDFDDIGREKAIQYVVDKYGYQQVAHIITYGTMAAKMSIKDVARARELPLPEANALAKLVSDKVGTTLQLAFHADRATLEGKGYAADHIDNMFRLRQKLKGDDLEAQVLREAEQLEGSVRNTGVHAAGIIIAPDDITKFVPTCTARDAQLMVTQFDGKVIEDAGMLKMDFLGLKTLSIMKKALDLIEQRHGKRIDLDTLPPQDEATFELFQRGETAGVFQFESSGMRRYLRDLRPTELNDLIAMNALYRPGPMDLIPQYVRRKHGQEPVEYPHPMLEGILKPTYGIPVYQEQVMQMAQVMGGFSLGKADIMRRGMGKKKKEIVDGLYPEFRDGALAQGVDQKVIDEVWELMAKFSGYGFNKSHSVAYAVVAYQTGYLKANYPAEYMASVLSNWLGNIEKITGFLGECQRVGVNVLGPDVNESSVAFAVNERGEIRFGLGAIKGAGEAAVAHIIEERAENGPYADIFDFTCRVNLKTVNKKTLESLAYAGAFDGFAGVHRAQYFFQPEGEKYTLIEKAAQFAQSYHATKNAAQQSLFGLGGSLESQPKPSITPCEKWGAFHQLKLEKDVVGFYLTGHPLDPYRLDIENFCTCTLDQALDEVHRGREIKVAGIVTEKVERTSRSGNPFCLFTIEDYNGSQRLALFGRDYVEMSAYIEVDRFLFLRGKVEQRFNSEDEWELKPQQLELLSELRGRMAKGIRLRLDAERVDADLIENLEKLLGAHAGPGRVALELHYNGSGRPVPLLARRYSVQPANALIEALNEVRGVKCSLLK